MKKIKTTSLIKKETFYAWLFIAPHIIGFLIFKLLPIIAAFLLSFCQWGLLDDIKWIGFKNFIDMYHDPIFALSMKNTLIFTIISVPVSLAISLFVAIQLNKKLYAKVLLRTVYFIPYISTITAVSSVWIWFFHPEGFISSIMITIGIENPPILLLDKNTVVYCLAVIQAWRSIGYAMLIYLAGLQAIPVELYESADIDGAKGFYKFKSI
ncbi:MAG TPA: sugar ABC transporter permease, partial [Clostridiales bacterium]|nr:sugar ABC transporter permease [Clostridiales bacterium]